MKIRHPRLIGAVSVLLMLAAMAAAGHAVWRIRKAVELARHSEPLQAGPAGASASLLIVGDSTGVGTGASSPMHSLAGLMARDHPHLRIVNRAADGARFADIARQLEGIGGHQRFGTVLVLGGGNDVIRLTDSAALARHIGAVARQARRLAPQVILMPPGNVGNAPFFFPPVSWLMTHRARALHAAVRQAAQDSGAVYVSLYQDKADDPFAQRPDELNAADGLHPSDAGYRLWYGTLNDQAALASRLAAPGS